MLMLDQEHVDGNAAQAKHVEWKNHRSDNQLTPMCWVHRSFTSSLARFAWSKIVKMLESSKSKAYCRPSLYKQQRLHEHSVLERNTCTKLGLQVPLGWSAFLQSLVNTISRDVQLECNARSSGLICSEYTPS